MSIAPLADARDKVTVAFGCLMDQRDSQTLWSRSFTEPMAALELVDQLGAQIGACITALSLLRQVAKCEQEARKRAAE